MGPVMRIVVVMQRRAFCSSERIGKGNVWGIAFSTAVLGPNRGGNFPPGDRADCPPSVRDRERSCWNSPWLLLFRGAVQVAQGIAGNAAARACGGSPGIKLPHLWSLLGLRVDRAEMIEVAVRPGVDAGIPIALRPGEHVPRDDSAGLARAAPQHGTFGVGLACHRLALGRARPRGGARRGTIGRLRAMLAACEEVADGERGPRDSDRTRDDSAGATCHGPTLANNERLGAADASLAPRTPLTPAVRRGSHLPNGGPFAPDEAGVCVPFVRVDAARQSA